MKKADPLVVIATLDGENLGHGISQANDPLTSYSIVGQWGEWRYRNTFLQTEDFTTMGKSLRHLVAPAMAPISGDGSASRWGEPWRGTDYFSRKLGQHFRSGRKIYGK